MFIKPTPVGAADVQTSPGIDVKKKLFLPRHRCGCKKLLVLGRGKFFFQATPIFGGTAGAPLGLTHKY